MASPRQVQSGLPSTPLPVGLATFCPIAVAMEVEFRSLTRGRGGRGEGAVLPP